jgi:hypothetical protein
MLASARWMHVDGELTVASEVANPGLRNLLTRQTARSYESPHFTVLSLGDATIVLHRLGPDEIDNDLAELVASELVRPGNVTVPRAFERCFAGVVLSSAPSPRDAWRAFYANTLSKLRQVAAGEHPGPDRGPVAVFGRIYGHARELVAGSSLLDVGTCFGFFPLLMQQALPRIEISALDVSAPILELARDAAISYEPANSVEFVCGDACSMPFADDSFDTVTALHMLEHLDPSSADQALREICRVVKRRVIVAVPLEDEPDPAYGHVQAFDREGLITLGEGTGWRCDFEEYLGGWIVLEPR